MAAQSSQKRIANYSRVLSKNCRKQSWLIIILCGLQTLMSVFQFVAFGRLGTDNNFYSFGSKFGLAAALAGVLIVPAVFKEVYNRQFADVEFSLPMSASERFRSKLLVLAKDHLLPFFIAQLVILTVALITVPSEQCALIVKDFLSNIINLVFTDAVALLCVSCCGSLAECIYTPVLAAAAASLILPMSYYKYVILLSGRSDTPSGVSGFPVGYPAASGIVENGLFDRDYESEANVLDSIGVGRVVLMLVINLLICTALVFLAYRFYKKRNGLNVGKPIVFKSFRIVFTALVSLTVIVIFFLNSFYLSILVGLLAFIGISISAKRAKISLRDLALWLAGFAGCVFSVVAVAFAPYITGGFGHLKAASSEAFDSEDAFIGVYLVTEKFEYRAELFSRSSEKADRGKVEQERYEALVKQYGDKMFADKGKIDEIISEIASFDGRYGKSFFENLKDYLNVVRYEIKDSFGYDDWKSGDIIVTVATQEPGSYKLGNDTINFCIHTSEENVKEYLEKLRARGLVIYEYDKSGW